MKRACRSSGREAIRLERSGAPMAVVIMLKELRLQLGHIHTRGALALASLAGQTEIKNVMHLAAVPRIVRVGI